MHGHTSNYSGFDDRHDVGDSTYVLRRENAPVTHRASSLHGPPHVRDMVQEPDNIRCGATDRDRTYCCQHG